MKNNPKYIEDNKPWLTTDEAPPTDKPIWVLWKTRLDPEYIENAYQISDDFWFAEVYYWKCCEHQICYPEPERVISPVAYDEDEG